MKKPALLLVLVLCVLLPLYSQPPGIPLGPSPEAARLGTYDDLPVSLFTGTPDISIPLWTVKGLELGDQLTLSYSPSDLRVYQEAGPVGLGWSLQVGGLISRTMHGLPDEMGGRGFLNCQPLLSSVSNPDNLPYAIKRLCAEGQLDLEPDVFNVSAPGLQCRLIFAFDPVMGTLVPQPTPFSNVRVQELYGVGGITGWIIVNTNGTTYHFGTLPGQRTALDATLAPGNYSGGLSYYSAWHLLKMVSPGNTDSIEYYYELPYVSTHANPLSMISIPLSGCQSSSLTYDMPMANTTGVRLSRIIFPAGQIRLSYHTQRLDLPNSEPMLDTLLVYGRGNTLIRSYVLWHSYFNASSFSSQQPYLYKRLRLDSLAEHSPVGTRLPAYKMSYHNGALPPKDSKAFDHWGYYNGADQNQHLVPSFSDGSVQFQGADRECNANTCLHASLSTLTNPLGGKLILQWEAHRAREDAYNPGSAIILGGGLRIASIVRDDGINPSYTRKFLYSGSDGVPSGVLLSGKPLYHYINYVPQVSLSQHGLPLITNVCTYLNVFSSNQIQNPSSSPAPVVYPRVREVLGNLGEYGEIESVFTFTPETRVAHYPFPPSNGAFFKRGQLYERSIRNASGKLRSVEQIRYQYPNASPMAISGLKVAWLEKSIGPAYDRFQLSAYQYETGHARPDSMIIHEYDESGLQSNCLKRIYHYSNSLHLQPDHITTIYPDGRTEEQAFVYTEDLLPAGSISRNSVGYHAARQSQLVQRAAQLNTAYGNDITPSTAQSQSTQVMGLMELDELAFFDSLMCRPNSFRISAAVAGKAAETVEVLLKKNILGTIWMEERSVKEGTNLFLLSSEVTEHNWLASGLVRPLRHYNSDNHSQIPAPGTALKLNNQGNLQILTPHLVNADFDRYDAAGRIVRYSLPDGRVVSIGYDNQYLPFPALIVRGDTLVKAWNFNGLNIGMALPSVLQNLGAGDTACQLPLTIPCPSAGEFRIQFRYQGAVAPLLQFGGQSLQPELLGTDKNGWTWASFRLSIPAAANLILSGNTMVDDIVLTSTGNLIEYRKYDVNGNVLIDLKDAGQSREFEYDPFGRLVKSSDLKGRTRESWEYQQSNN
jgi:YD repeat-containing protein